MLPRELRWEEVTPPQNWIDTACCPEPDKIVNCNICVVFSAIERCALYWHYISLVYNINNNNRLNIMQDHSVLPFMHSFCTLMYFPIVDNKKEQHTKENDYKQNDIPVYIHYVQVCRQ